MTILCIDGMNFFHRSRVGLNVGPAPVIFNFMRNFRSIIEKFKPSRVYFVLEGRSEQRKNILKEYKANRKVEEGSKKQQELQKFFSQVNEVVALLSSIFPISVIRHPQFECDDTIYNLIKKSSIAVDWVVVSNDSDFTQLLNEFKHVKLYNPMTKNFVVEPDYDYVTWKSLRGDGSDNIPGIPGVGDKTAFQAMEDPTLLETILGDVKNAEIFNRNYELIRFITWTEHDESLMTCSLPTRNWEVLKQTFQNYQFNSLVKDDSWEKFINTFEPLFG